MDYHRIVRDIELKKFAPVYFFCGEEGYFIDQLEKVLEEKVLTPEEEAFNKTVVYGRDTTMDDILSVAKGFPMIGERQLVLVKEAQDLGEWRKQEALEGLVHYLSSPQPATILVFSHRNKSLDGRTNMGKLLKKKAVMAEFKPLREFKIAQWVIDYLGAKGKRISSRAANILAEYVGANLGKLANELDKLVIVVKEDEITARHIEANIGISKDYNIFELQDALGAKDILRVNRIIKYFEANPKANPLAMVLPLLTNYFANMMAVQQALHKGVSPKDSGVQHFIFEKLVKPSSNYSLNKIVRIIGYIRECDRRVKGIENLDVGHGYLMKELVYKIMH